MEGSKREIYLGEESDSERCSKDSDNEDEVEDEEYCYAAVPISKLQPR